MGKPMNHLSKNYEEFLKTLPLEGIDFKEDVLNNEVNLVGMTLQWSKHAGVELDLEFVSRKAHEFLDETYHDTDSYLLYTFMFLRFLEYLNEFDVSWADEANVSIEYLNEAVVCSSKEDSVMYLKKVFGDDFPD